MAAEDRKQLDGREFQLIYPYSPHTEGEECRSVQAERHFLCFIDMPRSESADANGNRYRSRSARPCDPCCR